MPDPVLDILKAAPIREETKALVWDAYTQATDTDDLVKRLGPLPVPDSVKADLWDLKRQSLTPSATPADTSEGGTLHHLTMGMGKGLTRQIAKSGELVHQIPGVSTAVDLAYGTPGLSQAAFQAAERATEPSNTTETVGKVIGDVGTALATGGPIRAATQTAVKVGAPVLSRFVGRKAADLIPRVATEASTGGLSSYLQGGDPTTGAVLSGAIPVIGAGARAGVNAVLGPLQQAPGVQAAIEFARANGIRLDAATATGRKYVKILQKRVSDSLGGSGVAEAARAEQEAGLKRVGEELAQQTSPKYLSPEQAGGGVRDAVNAVISRYATQADTAYDALRQIEADPSSLRTVMVKVPQKGADGVEKLVEVPMEMALPVNLKKVKAMLRPIYDQMNRTMAPTIRDASPGYTSLKAIMDSPDYMPASIIDIDLSQIKQIVRGAKSADLRTRSQGIAAAAVKELDAAVSEAVAQAGPKATAALRAGRSATAAKYGLGETFETITDPTKEPVTIFDRLTKQRDTDIQELRHLAKVAPAEMPKLGRVYLDKLLERAGHQGSFDVTLAKGLYRDWQKLGAETKKLIYPDPAHRAALDRFFLLAQQIAENPQPSGTASSMNALNVMTAVPMYALAKILYNTDSVRKLTQGIATGNQSAVATLLGRVVAQQAAQVAKPGISIAGLETGRR